MIRITDGSGIRAIRNRKEMFYDVRSWKD